MHIIEQFTAAKTGGPESNEDVIVVTPDFIGVFDGSSLAKDETLEGMTGGRFAAVKLAEAVGSLPADIDPWSAVKSLTATFNAAVNSACAAEGKDPSKSLAAATMTLYSAARREIWRVGDCSFVVDGVSFMTTLPPAELRANIRQFMIRAEIAKGKTEEELLANDPTPALISSTVMKDSKVFANSPDPVMGYGVLNGTPVPENHIHVVGTKNARTIAIASDGYPAIFTTLAETEANLAKVIAEDPLCYKSNPQPKAVLKGQTRYDDVSYIRFAP